MKLPAVYFYLATEYYPLPRPWPERADEYWYGFQHGLYCWILMTYLRLRDSGLDCRLVEKIPEEGIIVCFGPTLPRGFKPGAKQLIVSIKSDTIEHPYAQIHIVQNPLDPLFQRERIHWSPQFVPLWPQTGLIGRAADRGDRFENAAFFGHTKREIAKELLSQEWASEIEKLGMKWTIQDANEWNDYSGVDVVIGIRRFGDKPFYHKPFSKLINAWRAGVPAILSADSAYSLLKRSDLDYLEARSQGALIEALRRLQRDPALRQAMIDNGLMRARELQVEDVARRWRYVLTEVAVEEWQRWCSSEAHRQQFFRSRALNAARLEVERVALESYAPWLRNRPLDLDEVKCETRQYWNSFKRDAAKRFARLIK